MSKHTTKTPHGTMAKTLTATFALGALLLAPMQSWAGRNVGTLPFEEHFDSDNYGDLIWTTQGATHQWVADGWRGGAARFTPPTSYQGYSGLGQFLGLRDTNGNTPSRVNLRFLIYHGRNWEANAANNKVVIKVRDDMDERPMIISRQHEDWVTYGVCMGTVCEYEGGDYWPDGTDSFRIGNPPLNRSEEWISVEMESDTATGMTRLYIYTQDGALNGLYVERPITRGSGGFSYIDILGGYMDTAARVDADTYFLIDEVKISTDYIGPPEGFLTDPPPAAPRVGIGTTP